MTTMHVYGGGNNDNDN